MSMAGRMFQNAPGAPGQIPIGNPPAVQNMAHGLAAVPTVFFIVPRTVNPAAAALNTYVVTATDTNIVVTAAGNWAAAVDFDGFAWVAAEVADEAAAVINTNARVALANNFDLKQAAEPSLGISAPTGYVPVRTRILVDQVAVPGGTAIPLNVANTNAYIVAHLLDCPLEFSIDNPFVSGAFDNPAIPTVLTLTSRTGANQVCNVTFRMHHSLTR